MEYTYWELAMCLIIYSFIGWIVEVALVAIKERKFCNRGLLNMPFCIAYGITMDILIVLIPTIKSLLGIMLTVWVVSSGVNVIAGFVVKRFTHSQIWDEEKASLFSREAFILYTISGLTHSPLAALWKMTKKPRVVSKTEKGTKEQTF